MDSLKRKTPNERLGDVLSPLFHCAMKQHTYESHEPAPGIISLDAQIHQLIGKIKKIAKGEHSVVIQGANGTGKKLFAQTIHYYSGREGPFVDVDCSKIPESLSDSLLFGHEEKSFVEAAKWQIGFFSQAANGTLFLDEIAELPLVQQTKLLRVLESKRFSQVGSHETIPFTGRIVAASQEDLNEMVQAKAFHEHLLNQLNTFELKIPSLSERPEDIPLLVNHFTMKMGDITFSQDALDLLKNADWPGNVRQLKNIIKRISILTESSVITAEEIQRLEAV